MSAAQEKPTPKPGETRHGTCTWCERPTVQVWRRYAPAKSDGYWSEEKCPCGSLSAIVGQHNNMKHVGRFEQTIHGRKT
jgi:hypothetical protein